MREVIIATNGLRYCKQPKILVLPIGKRNTDLLERYALTPSIKLPLSVIKQRILSERGILELMTGCGKWPSLYDLQLEERIVLIEGSYSLIAVRTPKGFLFCRKSPSGKETTLATWTNDMPDIIPREIAIPLADILDLWEKALREAFSKAIIAWLVGEAEKTRSYMDEETIRQELRKLKSMLESGQMQEAKRLAGSRGWDTTALTIERAMR